jgi:hypothetical protein
LCLNCNRLQGIITSTEFVNGSQAQTLHIQSRVLSFWFVISSYHNLCFKPDFISSCGSVSNSSRCALFQSFAQFLVLCKITIQVLPFLGCFPGIWQTQWRPTGDTIPEINNYILLLKQYFENLTNHNWSV